MLVLFHFTVANHACNMHSDLKAFDLPHVLVTLPYWLGRCHVECRHCFWLKLVHAVGSQSKWIRLQSLCPQAKCGNGFLGFANRLTKALKNILAVQGGVCDPLGREVEG
jgi:hypothetical protein